jgi:hypothetical protein
VRQHLDDTDGLIWSEAMLAAAVRESLLSIGRVLGESLTLAGLDEAEETTLPDDHQQLLVAGATAYALSFRVSGRFEDARAREALPEALADWASEQMARFQSLLRQAKSGSHQRAALPPYGEWEWEEDT